MAGNIAATNRARKKSGDLTRTSKSVKPSRLILIAELIVEEICIIRRMNAKLNVFPSKLNKYTLNVIMFMIQNEGDGRIYLIYNI